MRLLAIGHSHLTALQTAAEHQGLEEMRFLQLREEKYTPPVAFKPSVKLNPTLLGAVEELTASASFDATLIYIFGNIHNLMGLVEVGGPLAPAPVPPQENVRGRHYVPHGVLKASVGARMELWLQLMRLLKPHAAGRVVVLEPPPPLPEQQIHATPHVFGKLLKQHPVAPAWVRHAFWRMQTEVLREACAQESIDFVPIPEDVQQEDGLLKQPFCASDPAHANDAYGARLLQHLRVALR